MAPGSVQQSASRSEMRNLFVILGPPDSNGRGFNYSERWNGPAFVLVARALLPAASRLVGMLGFHASAPRPGHRVLVGLWIACWAVFGNELPLVAQVRPAVREKAPTPAPARPAAL